MRRGGRARQNNTLLCPLQITNWWMAAAPGHPALRYLLDKIASQAGARLYDEPHIDTIARTGPGVFTEAVLWGALRHPPSKARQGLLGLRSDVMLARHAVAAQRQNIGLPSCLQRDGFAVRVLPRACGGWNVGGIMITHPPIITHKYSSSW